MFILSLPHESRIALEFVVNTCAADAVSVCYRDLDFGDEHQSHDTATAREIWKQAIATGWVRDTEQEAAYEEYCESEAACIHADGAC
jgi:hypothetical protein